MSQQAISYPLPLKTENNNLYGFTFAHLDKLLIKVDDDPNPQFILKLIFHINSLPTVSYTHLTLPTNREV